jgi:hypothetical protein
MKGVDNPLRFHLPKFPRLDYSFSQIVTGARPESPASTSARAQPGSFHSKLHRRSSRVVRPVLSFHGHLIFVSEPIHMDHEKRLTARATARTPSFYTWVK